MQQEFDIGEGVRLNAKQAIQTVLVVGAGWVGRQIAACLAQSGIEVSLYDVSRNVLEDAMAWLRSPQSDATNAALFDMAPATPARQSDNLELPTWISRVTLVQNDALPSQVDLVIECVPEQVSVKKRTLRGLSKRYLPPTIIASNSSYFVPSMLAKFVDQPERFAHCHFHVPVLRRSVVDIVGTDQTRPEVLDRLHELIDRTGHRPIKLANEHPGYIFNWLLQSVLRSALELRAGGVASYEEIDQSWIAVTGMPLGPFGIMDQIGLDVVEHTLHNAKWAPQQSLAIDNLLAVLKPHLDAGNFGKKSGRGFYDYDQQP